jgi:hypothetical protein
MGVLQDARGARRKVTVFPLVHPLTGGFAWRHPGTSNASRDRLLSSPDLVPSDADGKELCKWCKGYKLCPFFALAGENTRREVRLMTRLR